MNEKTLSTGARKAAFDLISELATAEAEIERCVGERIRAEDRYSAQYIKRERILAKLTDLINRYMASSTVVGDDGK
jgi:hypothetical protein